MKRNISDLAFFQCPVVELGGSRSAKGIRETGLPLIPANADGIKENDELLPKGEKIKKVIKIIGIVAAIALFIGVTIAIFLPEF